MEQYDIILHKVNEAVMYVKSDNETLQELSDYTSAYVDNYRFTPKYKQGLWDGKITALDSRSNTMGIGLVNVVKEFAKKGKYSLKINFDIRREVSYNSFLEFVKELKITDNKGEPMTPYDYQLQAAYDCITNCHQNVSSSTGSGKSLILYIVACWMESQDYKSLIIVNSVQLVEQLFGDFYSYGMEDVEQRCCRIYAGQKRMMDRKIIISTYQSLWNDVEEFLAIDCLMIDECHSAKSKSISDISKKCVNAFYRLGFSGTYPNEKTVDWFTIVAGTGSVKVYSTYKTLQENNQISDLKIKAIRLSYPDEVKYANERMNNGNFAAENEFINSNPKRTKFLIKLASSLEGNTLMLFTTKDVLGKPLYNMCKEMLTEKKVMYIDGNTKIEDRERIRHFVEKESDCVLCATYGCLSTGVNIKRIHNIVFCSGYKSHIKVLQSLGRGVRKADDKEYLTLFDIVDDLKISDRVKKIYYTNTSLTHFRERMKIYEKEQFDVELIQYNIK